MSDGQSPSHKAASITSLPGQRRGGVGPPQRAELHERVQRPGHLRTLRRVPTEVPVRHGQGDPRERERRVSRFRVTVHEKARLVTTHWITPPSFADEFSATAYGKDTTIYRQP